MGLIPLLGHEKHYWKLQEGSVTLALQFVINVVPRSPTAKEKGDLVRSVQVRISSMPSSSEARFSGLTKTVRVRL